MKIYNTILLVLYFIASIKAIDLNIVIQAFFEYSDLYSPLINDFNTRYAKEKNLDIHLNLQLFSAQNSSLNEDFYSSTLSSILNKKSSKYDIFLYDQLNTRTYSPYFIDLKQYLPKEHMNMYTSSNEAVMSGYYDGKWIGLPIYVKYKLLYSNKAYLKKYNRTIPETWDELVETAQYILEREHAENNTEIIGYNALMPKNDITMCSIYEYLYSFRENLDDPMPEFNSERALYAFKKFNIIKNATTTNDILTADPMYSASLMHSGITIFSSYFDYNIDDKGHYYTSEMPGEINGIHGSCLTSYNIGVPKFIPEEKIRAAVEVVKYFTSLETQKNVFVKIFKNYSAIKSLYDDPEVCEYLNCTIAKKIQSIQRPGNLVEDYDSYAARVVNLFFDYLYNKKSAKDILLNIDNLTRVYTFTVKSTVDLIFFIILIALFYLVLFSPGLLFISSLKNNFHFLSVEGWILYSIGFALFIINEVLQFGKLTIFKCNLSNALFSTSFACIYTPIIQKLFSNIPLSNTFSKWVDSNPSQFNFIVIFTVLFYNILYIFQPYYLKTYMYGDDNNHSVCMLKNNASIALLLIQIFMCFCLYLCIVILIFLEWHMENTLKSIRNLTFTMATSAPSLIILIVIKFINTNDFRIIYYIHASIAIIFIISNHTYIFFIRLLFKNDSVVVNLSHSLFRTSHSNSNIKSSDGADVEISSPSMDNIQSPDQKISSRDTSQSKLSMSSMSNRLLSCHYAKNQI